MDEAYSMGRRRRSFDRLLFVSGMWETVSRLILPFSLFAFTSTMFPFANSACFLMTLSIEQLLWPAWHRLHCLDNNSNACHSLLISIDAFACFETPFAVFQTYKTFCFSFPLMFCFVWFVLRDVAVLMFCCAPLIIHDVRSQTTHIERTDLRQSRLSPFKDIFLTSFSPCKFLRYVRDAVK